MVSPGKLTSKIPAIVLAAVASPFLLLTIFLGGQKAEFVLRSSKVAATFEGAVAHSGGNHGGTFFYPRFKFTTPDGRPFEMTSRIGSTEQPYSDGQKEFVLYDPLQPTNAILDHFEDLWFPTTVVGILTLFLLGLALLFWRVTRRSFQRS